MSRPVFVHFVLAQLLALALFAPPAHATPLRIDQSAERLRVDGALREWKGARFTTLGSGDDAAVRFALATTEGDGIYLAAEVSDQRLVRRSGVGPRQDALVLVLAMPGRDGAVRAVEIWLHPGEPGKSKAQAGIAAPGESPRVAADVKVVEGPRAAGPGYVIEAFVPFRLVPGAEIWEQGRGALRFEDVDSEQNPRVENALSTEDAKRAADLPRLALGAGQQDFLGTFLSAQSLSGAEPRFDFRGQVAGDSAPERVVVVDKYAVVYGPHYKEGKGFTSFAFPFGMGGGLKSAALDDVTGDGIEELTCVVRQRNDLGSREVWFAISFAEDKPRILFGIELRKEAQGGFIESKLSIEKKTRAASTLRVSLGDSSGFSAESYRETPSAEVESILLPWESVVSRAYQFDGTRLKVIDEKRDPRKRETAHTEKASPQASPAVVDDAPIAPTLEAVLALFKEERGLRKNATASRHIRADLVGSRALEDVFAFGAQLVIVGPDIGQGASYFAYGLPISDDSDLRHLGAADVTGDGKAELFVRVRQVLGGVEGVKRGVMLVHRFDEQQRFSRILSVEAFRYQDSAHISNRVSTKGYVLVVSPGYATGWTQANYPFVDEPVAGVGRLLLPWKGGSVRYRFTDGALTPE